MTQTHANANARRDATQNARRTPPARRPTHKHTEEEQQPATESEQQPQQPAMELEREGIFHQAEEETEEEEAARNKAGALAEVARAEKAGVLCGVCVGGVTLWEVGAGICSSL